MSAATNNINRQIARLGTYLVAMAKIALDEIGEFTKIVRVTGNQNPRKVREYC